MSAMSELAAAGATFLPDIGETVARMPHNGAPDHVVWTVRGFDRRRLMWRLVGPDGVYCDAAPDEITPLGRPDALERAAGVAPLHTWHPSTLRAYLAMSQPDHCAECGRARGDGGAS